MIILAHISDIHLSPLPKVQLRELFSKRLTGWLNWNRKRKNDFRRDVLADTVKHAQAQNPDMLCITGDLVNLALDEEIERARVWLSGLGDSQKVCAIPGNHDAYLSSSLPNALKAYGKYMGGETLDNNPFPFVRRIGNVAIICVSSAIATPPFFAAGKVDTGQLERLGRVLKLLGDAGYFRVVTIHHPPSEVLARSKRKGLWDSANFRAVLQSYGAELILHGHYHISSITYIEGQNRAIPVVGVPSASSALNGHDTPSGYNIFCIDRSEGGWICSMREFGLSRETQEMILKLETRLY